MKNKKINIAFYSILILSFIIFILPGKYKVGVYSLNYLGYFLMFLILLLIIIFTIIFIQKIRNHGFLKGIKEMSINIFVLLLFIISSIFIRNVVIKKENQINIDIANLTGLGISNIKLEGRNAKSEIDTLAPNSKYSLNFQGKNINYKTKNDFENEISLHFFYDDKWREIKIVGGFNKWKVLNKDLEINIHSEDSIELKSKR